MKPLSKTNVLRVSGGSNKVYEELYLLQKQITIQNK